MGCASSAPVPPERLAKVDTGVMVLSHSHTTYTQSVDGTFMQSNTYKSGAGGAVLRGDGQTLYVLGNKGLAVFDCRNPAAPQRLGVYDTGAVSGASGAALAFHNDGVTMYIAGGKGLSVFDVSGDRRFPRKVGSTLETGALSGNGGAALAFDGDGRLYVAGGKGLVVYDVNDQRAPRKVLIPPRITGVIDTGAIASECQCALCFSHPGTAPRALYVAGGKGLAVFDLANPDLPRKVGKTMTKCGGGVALALHPQKALVFVAGEGGLALVDISDPLAPFVSMKFEHTGCQCDGASLAVDDTTLLLAGGYGLGAFDLTGGRFKRVTRRGTNPGWYENRTLDTGVVTSNAATALLMDGGVIYAAGGGGLAVIDAQQLLGRTCSRAALGPDPGAGIEGVPWPPPPPPGTMQVTIPPGIRPGMQFPVSMPDGRERNVTCPEGVQPGQTIEARVFRLPPPPPK